MLAAVALAATTVLAGCGGADENGPLLCYVGGTMRPAMEELARIYEKDTGRPIELDYGDSGACIIKAETSRRGDLVVVHDPFHGAMERKGLVLEGWVVATLEPMIAVAKGNPKNIMGLKDLARPGLRLVLTDATYSTAGHVVRTMCRKAGIEEAVEKNVATRTRAGGEAANAVALGHADAAITWNAVIYLRRGQLDAVPIESSWRPDVRVDAVTSPTFGPIDLSRIRVTIGLLKYTKQPAAAKAFAQFAASTKADEVWRRFGYGPAPEARHLAAGGAPGAAEAAPRRSLYIYCGAGLRTAMEEIGRAFSAKTGASVESDYGGSGMLISRLRLGHTGDLFVPGDVWYVELAEKEGLVESRTDVGWFIPVILVQKGNPKGVRSLDDLARPGLRLGLGNPKACQVGRTSEEIFAKNRIDPAAIEKNLAFSSVTVNELGLQVKAGQLDAAIVWDATAAQYADSADAVPIPPRQNVPSRICVGVLKTCSNRPLAEEFVKFLLSDDGRAVLHKHHYRTEAPQEDK
jgi:molybdate transport system substrate-binding protein